MCLQVYKTTTTLIDSYSMFTCKRGSLIEFESASAASVDMNFQIFFEVA